MPAGEIEIRTKDGRVYSLKQDISYGNPQKPMSWDDLAEKFRDCSAYSALPLPEDNVEKAIGMLIRLDKAPDVSEIIRLLAGRRSD